MHIPPFWRNELNQIIRENETIEDLQLNGLKLIQKKNAFRFCMDSVILADFASIRPADTVVDLGTGNGILPLLLSGRKKGKRFYAIELQEESAELAVRNMALNGLDETVTVIRADAARASEYIGSCTADAVICNPPYSEPNAALASPFTEKAVARNQESDTLDRFLAGAFDVLKGKGRISIVYPAAQMLSVMNKLQRHHLEPKRFRLVYPRIDKSPNLVLIEALKDAKPTLHPLPPMVIYDEQGNLTNELKSVYHMT